MFYSKSTGGFYSTEIHGDSIPSDSVEISEQDHQALLEGQSSGNVISPDGSGNPVLSAPVVDPNIPNPRIAEIKAELDALDFKRIRPIAEGDTVYIAELNKQVLTLRAELKVLTTPAEISVEIPAQEVIQEVANEPQVTL